MFLDTIMIHTLQRSTEEIQKHPHLVFYIMIKTI